MDVAHWCVPRAHGYSALLLALKRSAGEPDLCGPVARVVLDCTDSRWILMPAHVGIDQAEKSHMQFFSVLGLRSRHAESMEPGTKDCPLQPLSQSRKPWMCAYKDIHSEDDERELAACVAPSDASLG